MIGKILVVGGDGLIGSTLVDIFEASRALVWKTTRRINNKTDRHVYLDLSLEPTEWSLPQVSFSSAIICAAVTSIDRCSMEPKISEKINVAGTLDLANYLIQKNTFVVFVSSNQVFDGNLPFSKSTDPASPITEYGRQKLQAEKVLLRSGNKVAVVRFAKIIGPDMPLIKGWIRDLRSGIVIHPFSDMMMSPIPLWFAARVLQFAAEKQITGITQVSAIQDVSYEDVARYLARKLGVDGNLIEPISCKETNHAFAPIHTTLDISKLQGEFGMTPPDVWETIDGCIQL